MVEEVVVEAWQKNSVVAVEELRLVVEVVGGLAGLLATCW